MYLTADIGGGQIVSKKELVNPNGRTNDTAPWQSQDNPILIHCMYQYDVHSLQIFKSSMVLIMISTPLYQCNLII